MLTTYQQKLAFERRPTVLMMGCSRLSIWSNRYPVEAQTGTLGSVLKAFSQFPWQKPDPNRGEAGLVYLSLQQIAAVNPDIIFVQPYGVDPAQELVGHRVWRSLKAVQTQQVFEVDQFWHWGNGTRLIRLMLHRLLPLIYPHILMTPSTEQPEANGLRQRELCDRLGLNYREVAQTARHLGLSTHAYLQQQTGWQLKDELYYPPADAD